MTCPTARHGDEHKHLTKNTLITLTSSCHLTLPPWSSPYREPSSCGSLCLSFHVGQHPSFRRRRQRASSGTLAQTSSSCLCSHKSSRSQHCGHHQKRCGNQRAGCNRRRGPCTWRPTFAPSPSS